MATYCAVCGAPVNHDHYIEENQEEFPFENGYQWLTQVVGLGIRSATHGIVDDNEFIDQRRKKRAVGDGLNSDGENIITVHKNCWELAGKPSSLKAIPTHYFRNVNEPDEYGAIWSHPWEQISKYMNQLFDFHQLIKDNMLWMIEDPISDKGTPNKERILMILSGTFVYRILNGVNIENVKQVRQIIADGQWNKVIEADNYSQYREGLDRFDKAAYPELVTIEKPYLSGMSASLTISLLEEFLNTIRFHLELKEEAILVSVTLVKNSCTYLLYTKNSKSALHKIQSLAEIDSPLPSKITTLPDPDWTRFKY